MLKYPGEHIHDVPDRKLFAPHNVMQVFVFWLNDVPAGHVVHIPFINYWPALQVQPVDGLNI